MLKTITAFAGLLTAGLLPAQNHWWVDPAGSDANPGTQASPFQTINFAASTASAGDVIHLVAATYGDEQNHVQLGAIDLTIVGAGVGQTIIKAHSSTDIMLPAGFVATPTMDPHRCCIALSGAGETVLRDLTLDQGFSMPSSGRGYCLWVGGGADADLDNVECINARADPINGIQGPLGVNIRGDGVADQVRVAMRRCSVSEYGKGGVVANFDAHLMMDDCSVTGFNHAFLGLAAQNCVQVSRGASCEIRRCTFTDSWYDPSGTVATGVLLFDSATPTIVENCDFGNCQVGIYVFGTPATITGKISRNRVHTAQFAIYVANISGFDITENAFGINLSGNDNDAGDDVGGNTWDGNYYSSQSAAGSYAIPGAGAVTDANAQPFMPGFSGDSVTNLPVGCSPVDLVVGEWSGDTQPDFAALCQNGSPSVAVGLNSSGTFGVTNVPFGNASGNPVAICSGEFNGAAGVDLAVLTANVPPATTENKVYVFANDGSGNFSLLHTHTIVGGTTPSGIAAGDVDGDSVDDLAVSDSGSAGFIAGSATVLANDGTGTGWTASSLAGGFTVACRDVAIGDFVGGAGLDVAVTEGDAATGNLHLFEGDGLGGFVVNGASPVAVAANAQQVLAADVEGDGDTDLLVTAFRDAFGLGDGGLNVLVNDGAGAFQNELYFTDRGPTRIAAGDLGADADPDTQRRDVALISPIAGSVSVLGGWSDVGAGTGGIAAFGVLPTGVGLADVSGDGFEDLLYADAAAGTVVTRLGAPEARADTYGAGTAGFEGRVPDLYPVGNPALPTQPSPTFGLGLRNARPLSIAVIAAGLSSLPIAPGALLIDSIGATWVVLTDVQGTAAVPLPFPATPVVLGLPVYCQAGVFDADGSDAFFPGIALTNGLKLRIGL
ncbi:MAG: FG-GAP-like repeat-containing protein [bacterium]|nr:FG-GAP-like repeat-containing protein [bacterium]